MGKSPWSRKWQPTPVFLPGKFHGKRSMAGYSPWSHKESDMTEQLSTHMFIYKEFFSFASFRMMCHGGVGGKRKPEDTGPKATKTPYGLLVLSGL